MCSVKFVVFDGRTHRGFAWSTLENGTLLISERRTLAPIESYRGVFARELSIKYVANGDPAKQSIKCGALGRIL